MYCEEPYEDLYRLKFARWLAEEGRLGDHGPVSLSMGKYAHPGAIAGIEKKVARTFLPPQSWTPRVLPCDCTHTRQGSVILPLPQCVEGRRYERELRDAAFFFYERLQLEESLVGEQEYVKAAQRYWQHFGR
jgi:hypothetical protein